VGKRARFYMVPADLDEFEAFMRGKADVVFPPARSENPESMMLRGSLSDEASEHVGVNEARTALGGHELV
jgi:hypothetical protein